MQTWRRKEVCISVRVTGRRGTYQLWCAAYSGSLDNCTSGFVINTIMSNEFGNAHGILKEGFKMGLVKRCLQRMLKSDISLHGYKN